MNFEKYEFAENVEDVSLFEKDKLAFSVLIQIINNKCTVVLTDHNRAVICFSEPPYPLWIWTAEDISDAEKEEIWQICKKEGLLLGGKYNISGINMRYSLAEYFCKKDKELSIKTNMLTYDCPKLIAPRHTADGGVSAVTEADTDIIAEFLYQFYEETGSAHFEKDKCRERAQKLLNNPRLLVWKDAHGEFAAMCVYAFLDGLGCIEYVFCRKDKRRMGYAQNLVYCAAERIKEQGCTPMLYTNADYPASNLCYKSIGFVERSGLCTIG